MTKIVCEVYSRVSGYYRPVSQFNKGKRETKFIKRNNWRWFRNARTYKW